MRSVLLIPIALLLILVGQLVGQTASIAQNAPAFRVTKITPFDKAVPGQIVELQVEGLGGAPPVTMLPAEDFQIEVTQDGVKQLFSARVITPTMSRERKSDGTLSEMKPFQNVSFVVPRGLHPGPSEIVLSYRGKRSDAVNLSIVDRPLRPVVGGPSIIALAPTSLPLRPPGTMTDMGWRFERDSKVQLHVRPLVDPDDPGSAILVRFKQGDASYDAIARVVHQSQKAEPRGQGVAFLPARDFLEVEIPAALQMGAADMEIKLRANGAESDPVLLKVQITDTTRSAEAPAVNAPRLLSVIPRKVGAGQALMLSVDYLRTLNPDPSQTLVAIEHDTARYIVRPETNSALRMPNKLPDAPVMLVVRPTNEILGPAQVRVFNSLKGEQGGMSVPIAIEIVDEALPPEIISVNESSDADLAHLREVYQIQRRAGRPFNAYDPKRRYLTIRGRGIDPNPRFVRIALEQNGATIALALSVSYASPELLIVRLPTTVTSGPVKIIVANIGAQSLSVPATATFELSKTQ